MIRTHACINNSARLFDHMCPNALINLVFSSLCHLLPISPPALPFVSVPTFAQMIKRITDDEIELHSLTTWVPGCDDSQLSITKVEDLKWLHVVESDDDPIQPVRVVCLLSSDVV